MWRGKGWPAGRYERIAVGLCVLAGVVVFANSPALAAVAPVVSEESVLEVKTTSATLIAQINPQGLVTTYHFEYDIAPYTTGTAHGASIPVPGASIGAELGDVPVSQHPQDLKPDTTYYYRVVAANGVAVTRGPDQTFTTQAQGEGLVLPDGRAWEMVSPPDTNSASIDVLEPEGGVAQAAAEGGAFTWAASVPVGGEAASNRSPEWSQIYSARTADGWSSRDIAGPHEAVFGLLPGDKSEYKFFSANLSLGLVEAKGKTLLSPQATEKTPYLHEDTGGNFLPLVTSANVPQGTKFGGDQLESGLEEGSPQFLDATPDLSHGVLSQEGEGLTPNAPAGYNLYEWAGGRLQLVNVLPEESVAASPEFPKDHAAHAISTDGSRIVWANRSGEAGHPVHLYMRDMTREETVQLDFPEPAVAEPGLGGPLFQAASDDDHRVFFTDEQRLTVYSTASSEKPDLYEFETTNDESEPLKGKLTDLTVDRNAGESADVQGVLGASEDGSYVYLVAEGVLSEATNNAEHEKAAPEADNLYILHDAGGGLTTTFITQLSREDERDWAYELLHSTSSVSPDGRYLAFMSERELTGYDNHDANDSVVSDEEVFLYDAEAGGSSGSLVCASCNPTGARPVGVLDEGISFSHPEPKLFDEARSWNGRWLSANIPGWTGVNLAGEAYHQSRYLSDSGRLFFDSSDALVSQDEDGTEDVYEYEPPNTAQEPPPGDTCTVESAGYSPRSGGCVSLISSGTSSEESVFLDASESGGEVFFVTAAKLVAQDVATSDAVYDARECTTQSPCVSSSVSPPACTTPEACRAPSAPQPAIFGAPSSQTYSGAGNSTPATTATTKPKPLTRAQKLAKALKACERRPKSKRPACDKRARKRYGVSRGEKTSRWRT